MYSHDTYGLGHIRRTLAIAKNIRSLPANILILTGSPLVGRFTIPRNVDFVRIPGMIKVTNEEYLPLSMKLEATQVLSIRESIILATVKSFRPDVLVVDKAPLGLKKEVVPALEWIREELPSCRTVLGLRDVMDSAEETRRDWEEKNVYVVMDSLYDEIWVYGVQGFYDPVKEYLIPESVSRKVYFTGYIPRYVPTRQELEKVRRDIGLPQDRPTVLVTVGGGGDGYPILDTFLRAFETESSELSFYGLLVTGPFLSSSRFQEVRSRAASLGWRAIRFHKFMEAVIGNSDVVVSMGGYNTICEIFSQCKPCLVVPRTVPREEQLIRAEILHRHGFCDYIKPGFLTPEILREKILKLLSDRSSLSERMKGFPFTAFDVIRQRLIVLKEKGGEQISGPSRNGP
ncbi:glycosyltransferase family protein [Thermodesulforhabdus norvegica]|nr:glycosyltransferase [Thermodesulforhabdus norvegica]